MPEQIDQTTNANTQQQDATTNEGPKPASSPSPAPPATSLLDLIRIVLTDPQLKPADKQLLIDELRKNNPGTSDRWTYRYAILILGSAVLLTIVALWWLAMTQGLTIPDGLVSIGSAAVGGLAGLLTPGRGTES